MKPKSIRRAELTLMIVELTASGRGVSCLPNWAYDEYVDFSPVKKLKIGDDGISQTLYIACRAEDKDSAIVQDFVRLSKINSLRHLQGISLCTEPESS